jgi:hypothetical protein
MCENLGLESVFAVFSEAPKRYLPEMQAAVKEMGLNGVVCGCI